MLQSIFARFLIMPLIAALFIGIGILLKRKNALLSNKKLIVFILLYSLVMCLPGFLGFSNSPFAPWQYLIATTIYLIGGIMFVQLYSIFIQPDVKQYENAAQITMMLVIMLLSWYLFTLLFNWGSDIDGGYSAGTCMLIFPLPLIFYKTYVAFIDIPYEFYKVWHYETGISDVSLEGMDFNSLMVLDLEFSRRPDDTDRHRVRAKAPADMIFGTWFRKFISDYNLKFPNQNISVTNSEGEAFGWVFYSKRSFFHRRRLLDPDLTITQNNVREHVTIISKRVIEHAEENFSSTTNNLILQA